MIPKDTRISWFTDSQGYIGGRPNGKVRIFTEDRKGNRVWGEVIRYLGKISAYEVKWENDRGTFLGEEYAKFPDQKCDGSNNCGGDHE